MYDLFLHFQGAWIWLIWSFEIVRTYFYITTKVIIISAISNILTNVNLNCKLTLEAICRPTSKEL